MTESRRYTRLEGDELEAARALAARLYVDEGLSIEDLVFEFAQRERPVSFGTVRRRLLIEAGIPLRPSGGSAHRRRATELTQ